MPLSIGVQPWPMDRQSGSRACRRAEMPRSLKARTKLSTPAISTSLKTLFHEHASWHTPGLSSIAGSRRGRDAVCSQFRRYGGETGGTFRANLLNVLESEDGRVVSSPSQQCRAARKSSSMFSAASSSSLRMVGS